MIIFTHIPKTAGTSLIVNVLRKQVCEVDRPLPPKDKFENYLFGDKQFKKIPKCISGHYPFGVHRCFDTKEYSYFTFLRNPVKRWISHFLYCLENEKNLDLIKILYKYHKKDGFLFFLDKCVETETVCNVITKQLSGLEHPKDIILTQKYIYSGCYYVPSLCGSKEKYTEQEMIYILNKAKINLFVYYDFIGFQENYNEDIKRFCKYYNLNKPKKNKKYRNREETKKKFKQLFKDKQILDKIEEINKYDIELYNYAKNRDW